MNETFGGGGGSRYHAYYCEIPLINIKLKTSTLLGNFILLYYVSMQSLEQARAVSVSVLEISAKNWTSNFLLVVLFSG